MPIPLAPKQITNRLKQGQTAPVANETWLDATTQNYYLATEADGLLVTLFVESVSADLNVSIYTLVDEGKEFPLQTFPTITAPTTNLLLKKAVNTMSNVKITVTSTGAAKFVIHARGVAAAAASVTVLGAANARASASSVSTSTTLVIPSSLTDRSGMVIKNNDVLGGSRIWLGFSSAQASNAGGGYPLSAQESLGLDVSGGVELWASADFGTVDIRLLESGN
jgi:hypothetical protein